MSRVLSFILVMLGLGVVFGPRVMNQQGATAGNPMIPVLLVVLALYVVYKLYKWLKQRKK